MAGPHVGEYGEGYGVGLDSAMARWDEREAAHGRGPFTATASVTASSSKEQSGLVGNFGSVVSGYGPMWGTTARPPRYDTLGRPVLSGKASATEWWRAIPPGFELVPAGTSAARGGDSKNQTTSGGERGKRPGGGDQNARQRAKAFKVEGQHDVKGTTGTVRAAPWHQVPLLQQGGALRPGLQREEGGPRRGVRAERVRNEQAAGKRTASVRDPALKLADPDPGKQIEDERRTTHQQGWPNAMKRKTKRRRHGQNARRHQTKAQGRQVTFAAGDGEGRPARAVSSSTVTHETVSRRQEMFSAGDGAARLSAVTTGGRQHGRERRMRGGASDEAGIGLGDGSEASALEGVGDDAQRRREADTAREARLARRRAARDEQKAPEAEEVGPDDDQGLHGGARAEVRRRSAGDEATREVGERERQAVGQGRPTTEPHDEVRDDGHGTEREGASAVTVGAVEMRQGRGRRRQPAPLPELLQVATAGYIVERARRRVRNRAGRYVLEHQVEYSTRRGGPMGKRWLTAQQFEELLDNGKIEDDLAAGDGV
ncbi:hypothetical protein ON010_g15660 [Phytophthora cinnamomi]|nr:hypothetical protein ON010_g15660 [Phytophthora cinnamomi]